MGKGCHVVIHDAIHDNNEMGHRPIKLSGRIFTHNLGNSPIVFKFAAATAIVAVVVVVVKVAMASAEIHIPCVCVFRAQQILTGWSCV